LHPKFPYLKPRKAACFDEAQLAMLKALNRGVLWLFVRFKCGLVFWKGREKFGKSVERPHTLEGRQERMH